MSNSNSQVQRIVPIRLTDAVFDNTVLSMKERLAEEMRRMDEEMTRLSETLVNIFGQTTSAPMDTTTAASAVANWESLISSPLVEGDGDTRKLKLQFDVSNFEPSEVRVLMVDNKLIVTATHEAETDDSSTYRQYQREFLFPQAVDPERIVSSLTKDGILTVKAPLPAMVFEKPTNYNA